MKLDEGDQIVGVQVCTENDDVLLTSSGGQAIRFPVTDVRLFSGRSSTGVRGIRLEKGDKVISMAILRHVDATAEERSEYLKRSNMIRRATTGEEFEDSEQEDQATDTEPDSLLSEEKYAELGAAEQFLLTASQNGYAKRTSAYEYRTSGRGGKGIIAMVVNERNGPLVGSFPIEDSDQIMLVTDGGKLIRCPVDDVRVAGRSTQGVTVFKTGENEHVVSVERIVDDGNGENDNGDNDENADG